MKRLSALLAALMIAGGVAPAAPALAAIERAPARGNPAWVVDAGSDVRVQRDEDGTVTLFFDAYAAAVILKVFEADDVDNYSLRQMADIMVTGIEGEPATDAGPVNIDGLAGQLFRTRSTSSAGAEVEIRIYLVRIDPTHLGVMMVMSDATLAADERQPVDRLAASVRIARATI